MTQLVVGPMRSIEVFTSGERAASASLPHSTECVALTSLLVGAPLRRGTGFHVAMSTYTSATQSKKWLDCDLDRTEVVDFVFGRSAVADHVGDIRGIPEPTTEEERLAEFRRLDEYFSNNQPVHVDDTVEGFQISVNDHDYCHAGVPSGDAGGVCLELNTCGRSDTMRLRIWGFSRNRHYEWLERAISPNDRVRVEVRQCCTWTPPATSSHSPTCALIDEQWRDYYEHLKRTRR